MSKTKYKPKQVSEKELNTYQVAEWNLLVSHNCINVFGIYRPPQGSLLEFLDEFTELVSDVMSNKLNVILAGDFNLHTNNPNNDNAANLIDCMTALRMSQQVHFTTHKLGNTLNLIFIEDFSDLHIKSCIQGDFISDHCVITCRTSLSKHDIVCKQVSYQDLKSIDIEEMWSDYDFRLLDGNITIDEMANKLNEMLKELLNRHAPLQSKSITERTKVPWFDNEVKEYKQIARCREKLWRKYHTPELWKALQVARRTYHDKIKSCKTSTISTQVLECGKDSKKLFELVSKLTGSKATNPMPNHKDTQQLTEEFADHFLNKIVRICDALDDLPLYIPPTRIVPELHEFRPMLGEEIKEIIMASPSKFCELDSIPTVLLKRLLPVVLPDITSLVNLSLRTGTFANEWKIACVKPLIKSMNMELTKNNYRLISNCNFISKIVEKCMLV